MCIMSKTMRSILTIMGSTILAFIFGISCYTPTWDGYITMPGVVVAVIAALINTAAFLSCPMRPLIGKVLAILLLIPSRWFTVYCVMGIIYPGFM
jgi:hypothetical protein